MKKLTLTLCVAVIAITGYMPKVYAQDVLDPDAEKPALSSDVTSATIYGQKFSLDLSSLKEFYGDETGKIWSEASAQIPKVFPKIFQYKEPKPMAEILGSFGWAKNNYRNLYECTARKLADHIVKNEQTIVVANSSEQAEFMRENVLTKSHGTQVDYVYASLNEYFDDGTWDKRLEVYNAENPENTLSVYKFVHPFDLFKSSRAVYVLDLLLRQSPEVQAEGLSAYGSLPRETPECLKDYVEDPQEMPIFDIDEDWIGSREIIMRREDDANKDAE